MTGETIKNSIEKDFFCELIKSSLETLHNSNKRKISYLNNDKVVVSIVVHLAVHN